MHRTYLAFLVLVSALVAGQLKAQQSRPPSGVTIDETRQVNLLTELPARCMSLESNGVAIVIDRAKIETAAAFPNDIKWKTEEERLSLINGGRSREMLTRLTDDRDQVGCAKLAPLERSDASFLVGQLLENWGVGIYLIHDPALLKVVRVRYSAFSAGPTFGRGEILFYAPNADRPFFVMNWWVS
jgi:hypothetical protein